MALIPAGSYRPLYGVEEARPVAAFCLDVHPVTNGEYLEFVRAQPAWQRSRIKRVFADASYLSRWSEDLEPGPAAPANSPVTEVSWFAARAYARWLGRRLPTLAEWERAATADERQEDGSRDPAFVERILRWYGRPLRGPLPPVGATFRNCWGVWDLHGLVWEWVDDFNTALVTGESRADGGLDRGLFCGSGAVGAADFRDYAAFMRYAFRGSLKADYTVPNLGFRCAQDLPP